MTVCPGPCYPQCFKVKNVFLLYGVKIPASVGLSPVPPGPRQLEDFCSTMAETLAHPVLAGHGFYWVPITTSCFLILNSFIFCLVLPSSFLSFYPFLFFSFFQIVHCPASRLAYFASGYSFWDISVKIRPLYLTEKTLKIWPEGKEGDYQGWDC